MKVNFDIILTKKIKDELVDAGIYDKWLIYTKNYFDFYRKDYFDRCKRIQDEIQDNIDSNDIPQFLKCSFPWDKTDEGVCYWFSVYNFFKLKEI